MTWVLPVPAPATTSSGPSPCVTARRWSGLSPSSSAPSRPRAASSSGVAAGSPQTGIWTSGDRLAAAGSPPHAGLRGRVRSGSGRRSRRGDGGMDGGCGGPVTALLSRVASGSAGLARPVPGGEGEARAPPPPRPTGPPPSCPPATAFAYMRVPARAWRLLTTKPSPCWSSRASAKLWLPPVSSNGLKRTSPTRWTALRCVALERQRAARRARRPGGASVAHLVEVAWRIASRLVPSPPRVSVAIRRSSRGRAPPERPARGRGARRRRPRARRRSRQLTG